ncbi:MAG TPA: rhomboid family intramembrane serine protease, partial [Candidatus Limnocylindrales bacterium]|nr:rhomboid family intramembrane serine protease [Candidatus Limnocylindrales bacterium]
YSVIPYEITHDVDLTEPQRVTVGGETWLIDEAPGPSPIWLTLFSSMFMHGGWLHLLGNLWFLWIFGDNVERRFGSLPYLGFYLAAGVIASFAQIAADPASKVPSLGASGAIAGVLGAYIALFPTNRVLIIAFRFIPFAVPAIVAIGIWALLQLVNGFASIAVTEQTGGVAYLAHVGGFVTGLVVGIVARGAVSSRPGRSRY